ncbi:MAG: SCO family protein [Rhodanobacteraceae bacterium]|nr:SCO family protein [Rhodanobacteraceae bacterium]
MKRTLVLLFAALAVVFPQTLPAADLQTIPENSVYRFDAVLSDQSGNDFHLGERRGRPLLVAMFYTSCRYVCPLIIDSVKGVEHALSETERGRLGILLVSLDPARDDTAALKSVFDKRKLDATRWTLARTSESNVRTLAALLGVRYRALADGEFNHTSALVLLDSEGRRITSSDALGATPDAKFLAAVRNALEIPAK